MLASATRNQTSRTGANSKYMQLFWVVALAAAGLVTTLYLLHVLG